MAKRVVHQKIVRQSIDVKNDPVGQVKAGRILVAYVCEILLVEAERGYFWAVAHKFMRNSK